MASEPCLAVPCPLCRASAGEPCHEITWERAERRPHNRRRWAFREIFGRWPEDEIDEEIEAALAEMIERLKRLTGYAVRRARSESDGGDV